MAIEEGKFKIDDIIICKDTKVSEFENNDKYELQYKKIVYTIFESIEDVTFLGMTGWCEVTFCYGKLNEVKFIPKIELENPKDGLSREEEKKKYDLCKSELEKKYGLPDVEDKLSFTYRFPGGTIGSYLERDWRKPYCRRCEYRV